MEDALKARLIGASILVVLAVALLPELLSGPKATPAAGPAAAGGKGTRTITIDLGGASAAGARIEPRPTTAPTPGTPTQLPTVPAEETAAPADDETAAEATAETVPEPVPTAVSDEPEPATVAKAQTTPAQPTAVPVVSPPKVAPAKGGFSVQVGAFGSIAGARKLVDDLQADGLPAYLLMPAAGKKLHRVRVGPVPDRAAADTLATRLKARGLPVAVVTDG